jgi:hypothetical protein
MVADSEYFSVMVPEPDMAAYEDPNAPHELRIPRRDLNTLQDKPQKVVKDPASSKLPDRSIPDSKSGIQG